jgi:hypothetical protein
VSSLVEDVYAAIRALPLREQLKLVERVVRDVAEAKATVPTSRSGLMGMMADEPEVMDQVLEHARRLRTRTSVRAGRMTPRNSACARAQVVEIKRIALLIFLCGHVS